MLVPEPLVNAVTHMPIPGIYRPSGIGEMLAGDCAEVPQDIEVAKESVYVETALRYMKQGVGDMLDGQEEQGAAKLVGGTFHVDQATLLEAVKQDPAQQGVGDMLDGHEEQVIVKLGGGTLGGASMLEAVEQDPVKQGLGFVLAGHEEHGMVKPGGGAAFHVDAASMLGAVKQDLVKQGVGCMLAGRVKPGEEGPSGGHPRGGAAVRANPGRIQEQGRR